MSLADAREPATEFIMKGIAMKHIIGVPIAALLFVGALLAQDSMAPNLGQPSSNGSSAELNAAQNPFLGGVPSGAKTGGILPLSLSEAIKRGLTYNLGAILGEQGAQAARGAKLLALSQLLPHFGAGAGDSLQQVSLKSFGFSGFPGLNTIVGPFNVLDVRASASQTVLDFSALNLYRAESQNTKAAQLSHENAKELVAYICANLYLQALASNSRIEASKAQVKTAQVLYDLAVDQKAAGVVAGIETLRAQVELQAQQQRLIVVEDQFAKDKLALARAIGLPLGQEFALADPMAFAPISLMSLDEAVQRAYKSRPDLQSAQAKVQSAELTRKAAESTRLPVVNFNADYGIIGPRPWDSHGTFTVAGVVKVPIFTGGAMKARMVESDALLRQRQAELEDMKGKIFYEIQNAFLDLKAASDRVQVAQSAIKLANEQVSQSEDRFRTGVTNNVEVVQAQEALATASENLISSLHSLCAANLALARALGISESEYEQFISGK